MPRCYPPPRQEAAIAGRRVYAPVAALITLSARSAGFAGAFR
jgi:hypothetical protein